MRRSVQREQKPHEAYLKEFEADKSAANQSPELMTGERDLSE
jgi:hypothetical protein